jgi:hypothetical protein
MPGLKSVFANADKETLTELMRQAEVQLSAQLTAAIAADQRAMSFVSLMAASTVVLVGGGIALITADKPNMGLSWVAMIVACCFLASMLLAIWSARSIKWLYAGSQPENWQEDITAGTGLEHGLREQLENYDSRINKNRGRMEDCARYVGRALWVAWWGLLFGVIATTGLLISR